MPDRFYFHRARRLGLSWEAKTPTGEQSPAQRDFQEDMDACGWPYVLGTDRDLFAWLVARGIAAWTVRPALDEPHTRAGQREHEQGRGEP